MKVSELVPRIYYQDSRDFAFIGRLYEIAINYMKTGADLISAPLNTENINALSIDLLTTTLGFQPNPNYLTRDLIDIDSVFATLLRKKGSMEAIELTIQTLLSSQEIMSDFAVQYTSKTEGGVTTKDYTSLDIYLPPRTVDIMLLEKILDYILPAGMIYHIKPASTRLTPFSNNTAIDGKILAYKKSESATAVGLPDSYTGKVYTGEDDVSEGPLPTDESYELDHTKNQRSLLSFGVVASDDT